MKNLAERQEKSQAEDANHLRRISVLNNRQLITEEAKDMIKLRQKLEFKLISIMQPDVRR
jgi:hypothetical protein